MAAKLLRETYRADYHGDTIKLGLEHYDEIARAIVMDHAVLRELTYRPELIRLALPYLRENIEEVLVKEFGMRHPLVHELLHQSSILYDSTNVSDPAYDVARDNLEYFLRELKTFAPEFFSMVDAYRGLPVSRLSCVDMSHPATQRLLGLL